MYTLVQENGNEQIRARHRSAISNLVSLLESIIWHAVLESIYSIASETGQ